MLRHIKTLIKVSSLCRNFQYYIGKGLNRLFLQHRWPLLLFSVSFFLNILTGCATVRLSPEAVPPVQDEYRINAAAAVSSCEVMPSTTAFFPAFTSQDFDTTRIWYDTGWSRISLDFLAADLLRALHESRIFLRGVSPKGDDAEFELRLAADIGCTTTVGEQWLTLSLIVGTLDIYPFLGGPFPISAKTDLVCEITPKGVNGERRVYRSTFAHSGWAPMYTVVGREKEIATRSLQQAVQDLVGQIVADRTVLDDLAEEVRQTRTPPLALTSNK